MNIEQANAIPLSLLFERLNIKPDRKKPNELWFRSPFRNERTASFKIHTGKNVWYDFGEGEGGNTLAFVCRYLQSNDESSTASDALRWIKNMAGCSHIIPHATSFSKVKNDPKLVLSQVRTIQHKLLIKYLEDRKIPLHLAYKFLKELRLYNKHSGKHIHALGFANEEDGFEIRNPFIKGCIGAKAISFVRGTTPKPDGIHIFEGFIDFLSALADRNLKNFNEDAIILNSVSCLNGAMPYIKNYGYRIAYSWLDNDKAGFEARNAFTSFSKDENGLWHKPMNSAYAPHKDVNTCRVHKLRLDR